MKVVWLTSVLPTPDGGGEARRDFERLERAVAECEVYLISAALPPGEVVFKVGDVSITAEGSCAPFDARYVRTRVGRAFRLLRLKPRDVSTGEGQIQALRVVLARRLATTPVDLLHINGALLAPLSAVSAVPVALCVSELVSRRCEERAGESRSVFRRLGWLIEASKARRWERRWFSRIDGLAEHATPAALVSLWQDLVGRGSADLRVSGTAGPEAIARSERTNVREQSGAVVVCTRERPEHLRQSLPRIADAVAAVPGTTLIIVEQGRPTAAQICDDLGIEANVVRDDGVGAARARNIGVRASTACIVLFTDDDCAVPPGWVRDHLHAFADDEVVASLGVVEGLTRFSGLDPVAWPARHRRESPPWVVGHSSNMAVRRQALLAIGGFDERLGPGTPGGFVCEDADLIIRLLQTGGVAVSATGEAVRHFEWRSRSEERRILLGYERGHGAWIGKLARQDLSSARPHLRRCLRIFRDRMHTEEEMRSPVFKALMATALVRGLIHGCRLGHWDPQRSFPDRSSP